MSPDLPFQSVSRDRPSRPAVRVRPKVRSLLIPSLLIVGKPKRKTKDGAKSTRNSVGQSVLASASGSELA
jgi:hypothetical protein